MRNQSNIESEGWQPPPQAAPAPSWAKGNARGVLIAVFVALLSFVALYQQTPPRAAAADAPAEVFSSGRAMKLLAEIGRQPHPIGTSEHERVRELIVRELSALGVEPEPQTATAVEGKRGGAVRAATVHNVVARLRGTSSEKAVLLAAHYDTVPNSPGASDDGSAVATMLETLRALKAGPALKNDLIFLFTDGEEVGLLGAEAFVTEHPYAKDVGVVLNFEARGSGGPVMMFETSGGNGRLVAQLAEAAPHPRANSLAYEVYKRLPNDTDFTVFKKAKLPGLNFAFIDGFMRYHTRADSLENMDERSLQHQGSYALSLARRFGDASFAGAGDGDAVYTDLLGLALVRYPARWALPLLLLLTALSVAVAALGFRRGRLTTKGVLLGGLAFTLSVVAAPAVVSGVWWLVSAAQNRLGRGLLDDLYQSKIYFAGFVALSVAVVTGLYTWFGRRVKAADLLAGALCCWLVLLAVTSLLSPGASYLMTLTLPFGLVALAFVLSAPARTDASLKTLLALCLCAAPAIILLVPLTYHVFAALGLGTVGAWAGPAAALTALLVSHFSLITRAGRWLAPTASALAGVGLLLVAGFGFNFNKSYPKTDHIFYALNADTGKAVWATTDGAADEWTAQFLSPNPDTGDIREYTPLYSGRLLMREAPAAPLSKAQVKLTGETERDGVRALDLSIVPARPGVNLLLFLDSKAELLSAVVNGKRVGGDGAGALPRSIQYWAVPAEGLALTLEVKGPRPLRLFLVERSYGLPELPGLSVRPRPDHLMSIPSSTGDATLLSSSYSF